MIEVVPFVAHRLLNPLGLPATDVPFPPVVAPQDRQLRSVRNKGRFLA